jgi:hypothetical protein
MRPCSVRLEPTARRVVRRVLESRLDIAAFDPDRGCTREAMLLGHARVSRVDVTDRGLGRQFGDDLAKESPTRGSFAG